MQKVTNHAQLSIV